ncbi:hypothetical protein CF326_g7305 [Tilletia indica]|uniref:Uncharacterized protein n=1 Tax=Tilletia indica TaxID=43049 RepID=A0A177TAT9_9BASI|nr:hypothetical protein CF326_g7305 [Tilletia indica]KAE8241594.1 hypothetical protein A4X13_0g7345 [Tilletia indica]
MSALNWIARWPFGSLSVLDADVQPPRPEHSAILCWAINAVQKAVRLSLAHRGVLIHLVLRSNNTYGKLIYDTVKPTWAAFEKREGDDSWHPRRLRKDDRSPAVKKREDEILKLVETVSPRLFEEAQLGTSSTGSQLWAEIGSDSTGDSGDPQVKLIGDLFRKLLARDLPFLSDHDFADLPRIDISAILGYHLRRDYMADNVLPVLASPNGTTELAHLIFKTVNVPNDVRDWTKGSSLISSVGKNLFWGELKILSTLPPHPNVMPAPLALVTIRTHERSSGDSLFPEGSKDSSNTKLVGWLHHHHRRWLYDKSPWASRSEAVAYKLRYAYELCCGVQHLAHHGFYHPDLGMPNTLFAGTPPNDRLIVMDFEPFEAFHNRDGPQAPEVVGHWNAGINEKGQLLYTRSKGEPTDRGDTILDDWKEMPEALERLMVFTVGSVLGNLLDIRLVFSWSLDILDRDLQLPQAPEVGADPSRDTWEALIPAPVRELAQRCSAFDPRERPLLQEMVAVLQQYGRADTGSSSSSGGTTAQE